ncbi:alpha/beta hydrolase fold domain-containing protein [Leifsonia sp. NPDC056665]|uniref:alpha/beta hydrolase fold domain-containing protein n=1 Tax=Leifsonia sp. NPDC056665 TaxID=3345901 RepID=UPI0036747EDD
MSAWCRVAVAAVASLVLLAGCAQPPPARESSTPRVIDSVAYAPAQPPGTAGHLLDLYLPGSVARPAPLIIWSGGNGWLDDTGANTAAQLAQIFTPHGYAVAGVDIRSSSETTFPGQLSDIKAAIRFLRANAQRYHLDPGRFGVAGDSSGAWAAVMAAVTGDVPSLEGDVGVSGGSSRVQAAAAFYPPTDFLSADHYLPTPCSPTGATPCAAADPLFSAMLGCPIQTCPDRVAAADPTTYVSAGDPPLLLLHGQQDALVPWQDSLLLYQAVQRARGRAELVLLPNGQHGQAMQVLNDTQVNAGAETQSTDRGHDTAARPVALTPLYLVEFFDRCLG